MNVLIIEKLKNLQEKCKKIEKLLIDSNIISNQKKFLNLLKEHKKISKILKYFNLWKIKKENIKNTKELLSDPEIYQIAKMDLNQELSELKDIEKKLKILLLPKDPNDELGCFLEIKSGTGGKEAELFSAVLLKMYMKFLEKSRWNKTILHISEGEKGGYKEVTLKISSMGAYGFLKFESGGHRVQRIPETENQGRIHTSTCKVAVIPKFPTKELPKINSNDIRIDSFRASGAGGQHVNKTDSAIRVTHIPTGIVVSCQDERSQHKNKDKAIEILGSRIRLAEIHRRKKEESIAKKNLLGDGKRSNRIRTYNFPNGRITDHRIGLTVYQLNEILQGSLEILISPILRSYQSHQFSSLLTRIGDKKQSILNSKY